MTTVAGVRSDPPPAVWPEAPPIVRPDAGFSIVLAVTTILVLIVLGLTLVTLVVEDSDLSLHHVRSTQAFYAALAGVEYAVLKLDANPAWGGLPSPGKTVGQGAFTIDPPDTLDEKGGSLPAGVKRIVSTGVVGAAVRSVQVHVTAGLMKTAAGSGLNGYSGDGGPATAAKLKFPEGVAFRSGGDLYFADTDNHVIRRVSAITGVITTVAGNGTPGLAGDGGLATTAQLKHPEDLFFAANGDLYIADSGNNKIRRVASATGVITTVAGTGSPGSSGDGGPAIEAKLNSPRGIVLAANGDYYIGDRQNNKVRKVTAATGIITTFAGTGAQGYSGDGGPATSAKLKGPEGVTLAANGDLYVAGGQNSVIRRVAAATGIITTVAGTGTAGYSGDGGPATAAMLRMPQSVDISEAGDLYIADTGNNVLRLVRVSTGVIETIAGTGTAGYGGDRGPPTAALLNTPSGIVVSPEGVVTFADKSNHRVRSLSGSLSVVAWVEPRK